MTFDFLSGEIILVDKPVGWTSFDVVNKVRWALKKKPGHSKIKIGHGGTLDPLATGLIILATGKKTKSLELYQGQDKVYIAEIRLGATTPSFDMETQVDAEFPVEHIDLPLIQEVLLSFIGPQEQIPPLYSAKRIQGKRAYEYARSDKELELKPVPIVIQKMELMNFSSPWLTIQINCSKGTYIRTLAHDIGTRLHSGGHLAGLRRVASGSFHVDDAMALEQLMDLLQDPTT